MSNLFEILQREFIYLWYYFDLQLRQIFPYWVLGMVLGSLISVFAKERIHNLFAGMKDKRWAHQELHMVCEEEGYSFFAAGDYENALWSFEEAADLIERFWSREIPKEYALLQGPYVPEETARLAAAGCLYKLGRLEECDAMIDRAYHLIRDYYDDNLWEKCKEQRMKEYRAVYHKVCLDEYKPCI